MYGLGLEGPGLGVEGPGLGLEGPGLSLEGPGLGLEGPGLVNIPAEWYMKVPSTKQEKDFSCNKIEKGKCY